MNMIFYNVPDERESNNYGPFDLVRATYSEIAPDDHDDPIAVFVDGYWRTNDGQKWTDFVITS